MSCATEDCGDPNCPVCSVTRRFPTAARIVEPSDLRDDARALVGTKRRPSRDPSRIKRNRKALR